jgi:hypothetical protein
LDDGAFTHNFALALQIAARALGLPDCLKLQYAGSNAINSMMVGG